MVVACFALLVALGGTGIAAVNQIVPRNSVGTTQLQFGAVTDFALGQLPAGPTGPQGPPGPPGAAGAAGAPGPAGTIGAITVRSQSVPIADALDNDLFTTAEVQAPCNSGERAISGGTGWSDSNPTLELFTGRLTPVLNASNQVVGFVGSGLNDSGQTSTFIVYSLCYTP